MAIDSPPLLNLVGSSRPPELLRGDFQSSSAAASAQPGLEDVRGTAVLVSRLDGRARELLLASKKASTQASYAGALKVFDTFWRKVGGGRSPFPLSAQTELRFVAWLSSDHPVRASTAAQYLSAVRAQAMLQSAEASDAQVSLAVKGMAQMHLSVQRSTVKPTWRASWVILAAHQLILCLMAPEPSLSDCQALVAVLMGFLFLSRASTICASRPGDFAVSGSSLILSEGYRKSKTVPEPRAMQFCLGPDSPAWSISAFVGHLSRSHPAMMLQPLVSMHQRTSPAASIDSCIATTSRLIRHRDPGVQCMTSHSLRRGGAVSMLAVGVPLTKICEWGGWAGEASVRPYIAGRAFTHPAPADMVCFGWMVSLPPQVIRVSSPLV